MMNFLNNLSIRARMLLSVSLFLITLGLSMYSALTAIGANIEFAQQEKYGNQYQRPLATALNAAGILRIELAKNAHNMGSEPFIQKALSDISAAMTLLGEAQKDVGQSLQFTDEGLNSRGRENLKYEKVLDEWSSLAAKINKKPHGIYEDKLVSFISNLRGMIAHSGDTSNLILDPDLDSYYLMDATLLALPQTLDRLSVIGSVLIPKLVPTYVMSQQDRTDAAVMARMLSESDVDRLNADLDTARAEDPNFYGVSKSFQEKSQQWLKAYNPANKALIAALEAISNGKTVDVKAFAALVSEAQRSAYVFLVEGYDELDTFLETRISFYKGDQMYSLSVSSAGIVVSMLFFMFVVWTLTLPLARLTTAMISLANNKLDTNIGYTMSKSEVGDIARSIEIFKVNANKMEALKLEQVEKDRRAAEEKKELLNQLATEFEQSVGNIVHAVAAASNQLQGSAQNLSKVSDHTSTQASKVAEASNQTSQSVSVVASAAEELTASIGDISRQVGESSKLVSGAMTEISNTDTTVRTLAESSTKIGDVVNLINDIADQTNLLALNATIEAARAGDAGKGFAVVATEVKSLAGQTGKATEEIASSISSMQNVADSAIKAMGVIKEIIETINCVSDSIASSVSEQAAATQEISQNINQVSVNTAEVSDSIQNVTSAAEESMSGSKQVLGAAGELSSQSETLRGEVSQFISKIRQA